MTDREGSAERVAALEREIRRIGTDAQREADAMFAQYQLSQLLASGSPPAELAATVVTEVRRLARASLVGLWIADAGAPVLRLVAASPEAAELPEVFADEPAARAWAGAWESPLLSLSDDRVVGVLLIRSEPGRPLDDEGVRVVRLARHELAVAFRSAGLRRALDDERAELTAIVEGATDAILQVDDACRVVRINAAGVALLGRTTAEVLGQSCWEVLGCFETLGRGGHVEAACPLAEVLRTRRSVPFRESAVRTMDGRVTPVGGSYSQAAAGAGGLRATAILRDIGAARALDELRESFLVTVSHELRTPLALVKGYAETLRHMDLPPADQRHAVERIDELAERLREIVNDILDVAQLQAHPPLLERTAVAVGGMLRRLQIDVSVAEGRDRIALDLAPDLPLVDADPSRLEHILENIVGNALKYAPPATTVRIGARAEHGWVVLEVDDEGIGIPEADRKLVLEPFHRARNVRESNRPGTGLGLAISSRLVQAHGGQLWLGPRADGRAGTRVVVRLPAVRRPRGRSGAAAHGTPLPAGAPPVAAAPGEDPR